MDTARNTLSEVRTSHGTFFIDPVADRRIFRHLEKGEHHQEPDVQFVCRFIRPDSAAVDIGAHIGLFSVPLAQVAKRVYAYEPSKNTFSTLQKNIQANSLTNVIVKNVALGDRSATVVMESGDDVNAGANHVALDTKKNKKTETIPLITLDSEDIKNVSFMKIDVEGMEERVINGARQVLSSQHPVVFFEINVSQLKMYGSGPGRLQSLFKSQGYTLYYVDFIDGMPTLGATWSLVLISLFITPGSFFFNRPAWTFNILAVPKGYVLPSDITQESKTALVVRLLKDKIIQTFNRFLSGRRLAK